MSALLALPIALPLLGAACSLVLGRHVMAQRTIGITTLLATVGSSGVLLFEVDAQGPRAVQVGDLQAPFGITLVADQLAAIMLVFATATLLAVLVYAIGQRRTDEVSFVFHPVYLVLAAGVSAVLLTGDLFNLFVSLEVMLASSYVLITLGATRDQVRSGMTYVVISLLASVMFLVAVGIVYAATGTVNFADLSIKLGGIPDDLRDAIGVLMFLVLGIKAAIFPLFFWLPDSYPTAPTPVTAVFAGLLTKVSVYAIIRTQTLLFFPNGGNPSTLILVIAALTMLVGVLGAIAQNDIKRILSFHIVSQIGYMIFGLGLFTVAGIAAAIFFVVNQVIVKTALFLVGGLVEQIAGTASLVRVSGLVRRSPVTALLFIVAALSLAGMPPFSGFVPKLALVQAGFATDRWGIVAVSLVVSLLTLFSMTKIWSGVFWGPVEPAAPAAATRLRSPGLMTSATATLVAFSIVIAVAAGPLYDLTLDAAQNLVEPGAYVREVLRR